MKMTEDERKVLQKLWIASEKDLALAWRIFHDKRDVCHTLYKQIFADYDWSKAWEEIEKRNTSKN